MLFHAFGGSVKVEAIKARPTCREERAFHQEGKGLSGWSREARVAATSRAGAKDEFRDSAAMESAGKNRG